MALLSPGHFIPGSFGNSLCEFREQPVSLLLVLHWKVGKAVFSLAECCLCLTKSHMTPFVFLKFELLKPRLVRARYTGTEPRQRTRYPVRLTNLNIQFKLLNIRLQSCH